MNPIRPLLQIQPNLTVSIFLDHPVQPYVIEGFDLVAQGVNFLHGIYQEQSQIMPTQWPSWKRKELRTNLPKKSSLKVGKSMPAFLTRGGIFFFFGIVFIDGVHSSVLEGCNLHEMILGREWYFLIGIPMGHSG